MTSSTRISLLVALVVGALAAFLVRTVLLNVVAGSERAGMTTTIVVAKKPIPFGGELTADNLQEVAWKSADRLNGSFAKPSDLMKDGRRLALVSMQRNEPILESHITGPNQRATLSTQLEDGMRAVTVRVDEVRGVAGFILPGDRVDVITTRGGGGASADTSAFADILMQNVKVLAVDQLADERQDKPTIARAVTLELTATQAQKIVLAEDIGRLSLVLRQPNAVVDDKTTRVTVSDLGGDAQSRDKLAEMEKRLADMKAANETARSQAERASAQKMAEMEARLRSLSAPQPAMGFGKPTPPATKPSGPVVNVIRNGSKTESYTVLAEP